MFRGLAQYIRQVKCQHEFEREEIRKVLRNIHFGNTTERDYVSLFCPKCGYHKSFEKW